MAGKNTLQEFAQADEAAGQNTARLNQQIHGQGHDQAAQDHETDADGKASAGEVSLVDSVARMGQHRSGFR